mgnify:CR=1 FL=1
MIRVDFFITEKGLILGYNVCGHADYDDYGRDIVCAAVSSAALLTANTISEIIKVPADASIDGKDGMKFKISENNANLCRDVLLGFKLHMLSLEEQYPKNITVNYTEV